MISPQETDILFYIVPVFFFIALLYSSVGFGGGSSYLAIMALVSIPYELMPKIALICNLIVVTGGFFIFLRSKQFSLNKALPFVVSSIPLAYLGGRIHVPKEMFFLLLGISLLIASLRMMMKTDKNNQDDFSQINNKKAYSWLFGLSIGSVLGFLSGLVGIGGGIYLAPILYLTKWGKAKQIAAMASFFILVNSLSGLTGQLIKHNLQENFDISSQYMLPLGIAVFLGGQIGSRMGANVLKPRTIQLGTAILVFVVGIKILYKIAVR